MSNGPFGAIALRQYLAEFIGTMILVFFAAGAVMTTSMFENLPGPMIAGICSGLALTVMIWTLGGVSGAHFNPALTVILAVFDEFPANRVTGYILAQLAGSAAAAALLYIALGARASMGANLPNAAAGISQTEAFLIECFLAFVMMLVIRASLAAGTPLRSFAAVPIGAVVGIEVMLMGTLAGAAMNPARAFGPYIFLGSWETYWIYAIGPVIGIAAAALLWRRLTSAPKTSAL